MKRRALGRSAGLTVRMAVVLLLVAGAYAGIAAAVVAIVTGSHDWALYGTPLICVIGLTAIAHLAGARRFLLRAAGLETEPPTRELAARAARLAALADIPAPQLLVASSKEANAFTIGIRQRDALVVVTAALIDRLDAEELDAVVAHELAHIANRDAAVMTIASAPRALGSLIVGQSSGAAFYLWFFIWPLGLPLLAFGTLLSLAISRARELAADRGSAIITGHPEALMSALTRIEGASTAVRGDLRAVKAFCIFPTSIGGRELLIDHPPLAKRLAALAGIARELGRPAR